MPANRQRFLIDAVAAACDTRGITLARHCGDWLLRLARGGVRRSVLGYNFDLNPDPAATIARDKAASAALLAEAGVPHVPHELVLSPLLTEYGDGRAAVEVLRAAGGRHGWPIVVKPNAGTGGGGVTRCRTLAEAEAALFEICRTERAAAVGPLLPVSREVRTVLLDGEPLLCFEKVPPAVTGDGIATLHQLILAAAFPPPVAAAALAETPHPDRTPAVGERVPVLWRHNLGGGAKPLDLRPDEHVPLARHAADALDLRLAAVDTVEVDGRWLVMEVNAGVMLETYARQDGGHRARALDVYDGIVAAMFAGG